MNDRLKLINEYSSCKLDVSYIRKAIDMYEKELDVVLKRESRLREKLQGFGVDI